MAEDGWPFTFGCVAGIVSWAAMAVYVRFAVFNVFALNQRHQYRTAARRTTCSPTGAHPPQPGREVDAVIINASYEPELT